MLIGWFLLGVLFGVMISAAALASTPKVLDRMRKIIEYKEEYEEAKKNVDALIERVNAAGNLLCTNCEKKVNKFLNSKS